MIHLTPEIVRDYHAYMGRRYRAKIIHKPSAIEVRYVAWFLDLLGIADKDKFLNHFAITIGRRVYIPWVPGEGGREQWAYQCRVLTHEMRHVSQSKGRIAQFLARYAAMASFRTSKELDALRCDLEMYFAIHGRTMSVAKLTRTLGSYKIGWWNRLYMRRKLRAYNKGVAKGLVRKSQCKAGIRRLRKMAAL